MAIDPMRSRLDVPFEVLVDRRNELDVSVEIVLERVVDDIVVDDRAVGVRKDVAERDRFPESIGEIESTIDSAFSTSICLFRRS